MENNKNIFGDQIDLSLKKYIPITYQIACEVKDETDFSQKENYAESTFYKNKKMICYRFYKPISKII